MNTSSILQKLWNYCNVLRDDGMSYGDYVERLHKTIVPVRLAQQEGEKLVSRSQAKQLTMRFERFQTVVLDFAGVEEIGQAFADEVFRVFHDAHPATTLLPINMTSAVEMMFKRAMKR